ncbi:MAG: methyltransferase domain-containing protein [Steroidobacteraceae bacterium]
MDPRVQRRIQRYGWDLAACAYEPLWHAPLAPVHTALVACAGLLPGERVLDVACGTGEVTLSIAARVAPGEAVGVDLSGRMIDAARLAARERRVANVRFERMDAEQLGLAEGSFDVALCALGLMYVPHPQRAAREMRRMLRPGGRMVLAVWGERSRCGWSAVFPIIDAEVDSDVCPLFFQLGRGDALARLCVESGLEVRQQSRITATLDFADEAAACDAALVGGPVALAWSRFDEAVRARVRRRYLDAIAGWRHGGRYRIPGEFVVVAASLADGFA